MEPAARATEVSGREDRTYGQWWDWHGEYVTVGVSEIRALGTALYRAAGASGDDASYLFELALEKTLQGDHSRGLIYFPADIESARSGLVDFRSEIGTVSDRGATAVVDGGARAASALVCRRAMRLAIEKAREFGVGIVGARAVARHLTPLATMAAGAGVVGVSFTQGPPIVAPIGSAKPMFGTSPLAIGIPGRDHDPVIMDMALSETSMSPVLLAAAQGERVPEGLIFDRHGAPTTSPRDFFDGSHQATAGHVAPTGSLKALGDHKGYALIYVLSLLAHVLTDTSPPWDLSPDSTRQGRFGSVHIAIDPTFLNPGDVGRQVDDFIDVVAAVTRKPGSGEILYPGQRSQALKREASARSTIEVPRPQIEQIQAVAVAMGIPVPPALARLRPDA